MLQHVLSRLGVDRAVVHVLLSRIVMFGQALITVALVTQYLSAELQGFYYTFFSIVALQAFFELGFFLVIISFASNEWGRLNLNVEGIIVGDPSALSRLVSLGGLAYKWYTVVSVLFIVGVGLAGHLFLAQKEYGPVAWQGPWWTLVVLSGLSLWATALLSLLEGCNQVSEVTFFRLCETVISRVTLWVILLLGGELWAAAGAAGAGAVVVFFMVLTRYRNFFRPFLRPVEGERMVWLTEIWPMQWRVGLTMASSYFSLSVFVPIMFYYYGPVVAGQMGMTLQAMTSLHQAAMAWVSTKTPRYGILAGNCQYGELDRLWKVSSTVSVVAMSAGSFALWATVMWIQSAGIVFADRILDPTSFGLILLAAAILQVSHCQTAYLRAHRQEPMATMNVVASLSTGLLAWLLGSWLGPVGIGAAYLATSVFVLVQGTIIWLRCRTAWHGRANPTDTQRVTGGSISNAHSLDASRRRNFWNQ